MIVKGAAIRLTDAHAEAGNGFSAQVDKDGLQSVMAARTSGFPKTKSPKRQRNVVKDDDHFIGWDLVIPGKIANSFAAQVHESLWLYDRAATDFGGIRVPFRLKRKRCGCTAGNFVRNKKPDIVPGACVFLSWVSQAGHETKCCRFFHAEQVLLLGCGLDLFLFDDFWSFCSTGSWSRLCHFGLGNNEDGEISIIIHFDAFRQDEVTDV